MNRFIEFIGMPEVCFHYVFANECADSIDEKRENTYILVHTLYLYVDFQHFSY